MAKVYQMLAIFLASTTLTLACLDPDYLPHLKNQVRAFYEFYEDEDSAQQGPCSSIHRNQIARPQWAVSMPSDNTRSTCPWTSYINEDSTGSRYPCRLLTARSVHTNGLIETLINVSSRPLPCMRHPGTRHQRNQGKICQPILHDVPVVEKTGCRCGVNDYAIRNISITVGYTCIFEE